MIFNRACVCSVLRLQVRSAVASVRAPPLHLSAPQEWAWCWTAAAAAGCAPSRWGSSAPRKTSATHTKASSVTSGPPSTDASECAQVRLFFWLHLRQFYSLYTVFSLFELNLDLTFVNPPHRKRRSHLCFRRHGVQERGDFPEQLQVSVYLPGRSCGLCASVLHGRPAAQPRLPNAQTGQGAREVLRGVGVRHPLHQHLHGLRFAW